MIVGALRLFVSEDTILAPFTDLGQDDASDLYPHEYVAAAGGGDHHGLPRGGFLRGPKRPVRNWLRSSGMSWPRWRPLGGK